MRDYDGGGSGSGSGENCLLREEEWPPPSIAKKTDFVIPSSVTLPALKKISTQNMTMKEEE